MRYTTPEMEIVMFETEEVMAASAIVPEETEPEMNEGGGF